MPRERLLVIAGGTQAERGSGLSRLAAGTHPALRLEEGDTVVLSSRVIPGNDRPVFDMMAGLLRLGVDLVTRITDASVHASGHAQRDEQLRMIEMTEPQAFVPLHGTLHHLTRHAALARDAGVGDVLVAENGDLVEIGAAPLAKTARVPVGKVATAGGEELSEDVLRERAQLGRAGAAFVSLVVDRHGAVAAPPRVLARGVPGEPGAESLRAAALAVARALADTDERVRRRDDELTEVARVAARRALEAHTGSRPMVTVALTRL